MFRSFHLSLLLLAFLPFAHAPAGAENNRENEDAIFYWCNGYFSDETGTGSTSDRPARKLEPFVLEDMAKPADLVIETEIIGTLPPEIETYKGYWIFPSLGKPVEGAIFVERLTHSEMTLVMVTRRSLQEEEPVPPRLKLTWTGKEFASGGNDQSRMVARISPAGHAMDFTIIGHNRRSDGSSWSEAFPMCLISSKHY